VRMTWEVPRPQTAIVPSTPEAQAIDEAASS
jgi:hypothetical protein